MLLSLEAFHQRRQSQEARSQVLWNVTQRRWVDCVDVILWAEAENGRGKGAREQWRGGSNKLHSPRKQEAGLNRLGDIDRLLMLLWLCKLSRLWCVRPFVFVSFLSFVRTFFCIPFECVSAASKSVLVVRCYLLSCVASVWQYSVSPANSFSYGLLQEIYDLAVNQRVTVAGKATSVQPREKVFVKSRSVTLTKQEFTLADCTAVIWAVVWENHVGVPTEESLKLKKITVRLFNDTKYLSMSENSTWKKIQDIGEVIDDSDEGLGGA